MATGGWGARVAEASMRRAYEAKATVVYLALLLLVVFTIPNPSPWLVGQASTNLHNLGHGRIDTLATSALFVGQPGRRWMACFALLLVIVERAWGSRRFVGVFVAGHVGATLIVAVLLVVGIGRTWFPSAWRTAADVGVSYGLMAVIGALTAMWWAPVARVAWAGAWVLTLLDAVRRDPDFSSYGHVAAFCIGIALSAWVLHHGRARPDRAVRPVDVGLAALAAGVLVEDGLRMRVLEPVILALAAWSLCAWLVAPVVDELRARRPRRG